MTTLNKFEIEFFELSVDLKGNINKSVISKKLLKLNNPTYYNKYISVFAGQRYGFKNGSVKNPILVAIQNMIRSLKNDTNCAKQLQTEFAWAYNNYMNYKAVDL